MDISAWRSPNPFTPLKLGFDCVLFAKTLEIHKSSFTNYVMHDAAHFLDQNSLSPSPFVTLHHVPGFVTLCVTFPRNATDLGCFGLVWLEKGFRALI